MATLERPAQGVDQHQGAERHAPYDGIINAIRLAVIAGEDDDCEPQKGEQEPQPDKHAHSPTLPYDDTSVNGAINPEFQDDDGPEWDSDRGFPDDAEDEEDDE